MDKNIGRIVNNYEIIKITGQTKNGRHLYRLKCIKCGYIHDNMDIHGLNNSNLMKECHHIEIKCRWYSEKLRLIFKGMKNRCLNNKFKDYRWYGGKGIKVCQEWIDDPQKFNDWAIQNGYKEGLSIDRIDESKDYCPENCRWIQLKDNSKYKSTTTIIEINGIKDSGRGWSKRLGHGVNYINTMIRKKGLDYTLDYIKSNIT